MGSTDRCETSEKTVMTTFAAFNGSFYLKSTIVKKMLLAVGNSSHEDWDIGSSDKASLAYMLALTSSSRDLKFG